MYVSLAQCPSKQHKPWFVRLVSIEIFKRFCIYKYPWNLRKQMLFQIEFHRPWKIVPRWISNRKVAKRTWYHYSVFLQRLQILYISHDEKNNFPCNIVPSLSAVVRVFKNKTKIILDCNVRLEIRNKKNKKLRVRTDISCLLNAEYVLFIVNKKVPKINK